jgi:ParB family transcriptional regulator, chromosome partitioning protein
MAKPTKIKTLAVIREIPFNRLALSQANVRTVKTGVSIEELSEDIARRGLLQNLYVRPVIAADGAETGFYEVPAGGRRYRALERLVKAKRLDKAVLVPCIVRDTGIAEEDSLAENTQREALHPVDQYRAFQTLIDKDLSEEDIAARFFVTPQIVKQRLRLAAVSPRLLDLYVAEEMTLEHVMAFTLTTDHARQEQVWEALRNGYDPQPRQIRRMLTETAVHAANDRRAVFVGIEAYEAAGGEVTRDLFENDRGGWLQDPALLDRLVHDKLKQEAETLSAEGWKWIAVAVDFPYGHTNGLRALEGETVGMSDDETARREALQAEFDALEAEYAEADELPDEVDRRLGELETEIEALDRRPVRFDPADIARAGVFVSLNSDGCLAIERGYVRPEDEPAADHDTASQDAETPSMPGQSLMPRASGVTAIVLDSGLNPAPADEDDDGDTVKPLSERLLAELSAHRTIALRNAVAAHPDIAFRSVLHGLCLRVFYHGADNCMEISATVSTPSVHAPGFQDSAAVLEFEARHAGWQAQLPEDKLDLWRHLRSMDADSQMQLFVHLAAATVNVLREPWDRRPGALAHGNVVARDVGLDLAASGWTPTVDTYLGRVPKARILEAVREGCGEKEAQLIDHLKKGDMAREAERLLADSFWLPEPLRLLEIDDLSAEAEDGTGDGELQDIDGDEDGEPGDDNVVNLPAFLSEDRPEDEADAEFDSLAAE